MLSPKSRLAKTTEIAAVNTRGRRFFNQFFIIKALKKPEAVPRFAFVVSTKVSKSAVVRNRLRRVLREATRLNLNHFVSADYVMIVKSRAVGLQNNNLKQEFLSFCKNVKIIK
jgi:ribonuclease P protein component